MILTKILTRVVPYLVFVQCIMAPCGFGQIKKEVERKALLKVREEVWRAYFSNDRQKLDRLVPEGTIAINAGEEQWSDRKKTLEGAEKFVANGGKLLRLEFPRTEIQIYGDVAILYSNYLYEIESGGGKESYAGRATEIFVRKKGSWTNPGWHLDSGQ